MASHSSSAIPTDIIFSGTYLRGLTKAPFTPFAPFTTFGDLRGMSAREIRLRLRRKHVMDRKE
jgi:hypothetical protein